MKRMSIRLPHLRWWALGHLGLCVGFAVTTVFSLRHIWTVPILALWLLLAWSLRWGDATQRRARRRAWPWSLLPLALWWLYLFLADSYGKIDMGAVIFHLQAGIEDHGGTQRILAAILYTLAALAMLAAFTWLVRADHRWRLHERVLVLFLLAFNPLLFGITQQGAAIVTEDGAWLDRRYVPPGIEAVPAVLPNLIVIYMESTEGTYTDEARFGNVYDDLEALGERGVVFHGVRQIENTGWTTAGMIASQCGTPLMPVGIFEDGQFEPLEYVLPGVECLGDLLDKRGYRQVYMGGASIDFAGKGIFYKNHGFDAVLGREQLSPRLDDPSYLNDWGLYDDSLLAMAHERIRRLASDPATPYVFVGLTLSAHPPYGYPARDCRPG